MCPKISSEIDIAAFITGVKTRQNGVSGHFGKYSMFWVSFRSLKGFYQGGRLCMFDKNHAHHDCNSFEANMLFLKEVFITG
jgi:hypothetical protein